MSPLHLVHNMSVIIKGYILHYVCTMCAGYCMVKIRHHTTHGSWLVGIFLKHLHNNGICKHGKFINQNFN